MTDKELLSLCNEYLYLDENYEFRWKKIKCRRIPIGSLAGGEKDDGYISIKINNKPYLAHRLIYLLHYGYIPKIIDHIDGNPKNNHIDNLREVTIAQNGWNRGSNTGKSSYKNVHWCNGQNRWKVEVKANKKRYHAGAYHCEHYAAKSANLALRMYQGYKYCYTNLVPSCACVECSYGVGYKYKSPTAIGILAFGEMKTIKEWLKDERCIVNKTTLSSRFFKKIMSNEDCLTRAPKNSEIAKKGKR